MKSKNKEAPEFINHAYDIEIFSIFDDLRNKYPNDGTVDINEDIDNSTFFEMQEDSVVKALESEGIDLLQNNENRHYILPSSSDLYFHILGWKILTINPHKIDALLTYQSLIYIGNDIAQKDNFFGLVEFPVFQFVEANNYLNEDIRLEKIADWVNRNQADNYQTVNQNNYITQDGIHKTQHNPEMGISNITFSLELEFLKKQIQLLRSALFQCHLIDIQKNATYDIGLDRFDETIVDLDPQQIQINIDILLMDKTSEKLFAFLNNNFILAFKDRVEELRVIVESENLSFGSHASEYNFRQRLSLQLLSKIDAIYQVIKNVVPTENPDLNSDLKKLYTIPTNAQPEEILNFWLKLLSNNEKGKPYWNSEEEITHFVNQNFEGFNGVKGIKVFDPDMNKSELYQVIWTFFNRYGQTKTKRQYEYLLQNNFTKFKNANHVYSNIKDFGKAHLKKILSYLP